MEYLTLYELNHFVRQVLEVNLDEPYWLQAELSEVKENRGHCFVEFVQKAEKGNSIIAKARGQIWASSWPIIRQHFESTTGQRLSAGMEVLVKVEVTFHEAYGYSLNIIDIDPRFTLGDIAKRRQEIIKQLQEEGVFTMNKEIELPSLLQRIAVISAATAAGYQDFSNQLQNNPHGLAFHTQLFPAVMQGAQVEQSVIQALNNIANEMDQWDAVVIIRGGGAAADLSGFDTLLLAENVAQFPLPIITGIGHEKDDTVIDLVSHTRVKTPTAAAEFIIQHQVVQLHHLEDMASTIAQFATLTLRTEQLRLTRMASLIPSLFGVRKAKEEAKMERLLMDALTAIHTQTTQQQSRLQLLAQQLQISTEKWLTALRHRIALAETHISAANPERLLQLGFSITRIDGKAVTSSKQVKPGAQLTTTLADGEIQSTVNEK